MAAVLKIKTESEFVELMAKAKGSIKDQTAATKELTAATVAAKEETKAVAKATDEAKARAKALNDEAKLLLQNQHRVTVEIQKQDYAIKAQAFSIRQVEAELQKETAIQSRLNLGEKEREASISRQNTLLGQRARLVSVPGGGGGGAGGPGVVQRVAGPLGGLLGAAGLGAGGGMVGQIAGVGGAAGAAGAAGVAGIAGGSLVAGIGIAAGKAYETDATAQAEVVARTKEHERQLKELKEVYGDLTGTVYGFGQNVVETGRSALRYFGWWKEDVVAINDYTKQLNAEQERLKANAQAAREQLVREAGGQVRGVTKSAEVEGAGRLADLTARGVDLETRRKTILTEIAKLSETIPKTDQEAADLVTEINSRTQRLGNILADQQAMKESIFALDKQDADLMDQKGLAEKLRNVSIQDIQNGLIDSRATYNQMLKDGTATQDELARFMTHQQTLQAALTAGEDQRRAALETIQATEKQTTDQKRVSLLIETQVTGELDKQKAIIADTNSTVKQRAEALNQVNLLLQQQTALQQAEDDRANVRYQRAKSEYDEEKKRVDELKEAGVAVEDARLARLMKLKAAQQNAFDARKDQLQKERDAEEEAYNARMDRLNKEQAKKDEVAKKRLDALTNAFTGGGAAGGEGSAAGAGGSGGGAIPAGRGRRNPFGGLLLQGGPLTGGAFQGNPGFMGATTPGAEGGGPGRQAAGVIGGSAVDRIVGQASQEDIIRRVRKDVLDAVEERRKAALDEGGDVKGINEKFDKERRTEAKRVNKGDITADESATAQKELADSIIDAAAADGKMTKQSVDALKKAAEAAAEQKAFKEDASNQLEVINKKLDAVLGSGSRTAAQRSGVGG